jgi:transposase
MEHTRTSGSLRGEELRRQWQQDLKAWRASGESQVCYCRAHGLSRHAFQYWKHNLEGGRSSGFVELSRSTAPHSGGAVVEILIDDRVQIRVPQGVTAEQLCTVLQAVKEL